MQGTAYRFTAPAHRQIPEALRREEGFNVVQVMRDPDHAGKNITTVVYPAGKTPDLKSWAYFGFLQVA